MRGVFTTVALLLPALWLASCASYTSATKKGFEEFERRDFTQAETEYDKGANEDSKDQLVYVFDRGTVRYTAGHYEMSIKDFLLADQLSDIKDYTALGTEAASLFVNDAIRQYKGEEFEHVLVSVYLALNFASMGKDEEAAVAARQVNRKLEKLKEEGKRNYHLNAFAQYLAGMLFERLGNWNFANVDYKKTFAINPDFGPIKRDLLKGAIYIDSSSDIFKYKKTLGLTDKDVESARKEMKTTGGIALLYQNGFSPEKVPNASWYELPDFRNRYNKHRAARLYLDGKEVARTEVLFDVEAAAKENLKSKYAGYIAKRLAGVAVREVVGHELDKQAAGLGTLVKLAMYASSKADLRSWTTLPKDFQVARVQVKPGKYKASLRLEEITGALGPVKDLGSVDVKRVGDIVLLHYRSLND